MASHPTGTTCIVTANLLLTLMKSLFLTAVRCSLEQILCGFLVMPQSWPKYIRQTLELV